MKFMNSKYKYADFKAKSSKVNSGDIIPSAKPKGRIVIDGSPGFNDRPKPKGKSRPLKGTIPQPTLREPGMARNARSTAAGASQGTRDLFRTQGKVGVRAKSTMAGLQQRGRDIAYGGKQMLKKAGRFAMRNKVGVGLAAAGALGAVGAGLALRKMRSDKGKKRGNYN